MSSSIFKVIIIGGGPVGLTAAQALSKANIEFVLLERRPNIVIDAGSNLVLNTTGMRLLAQLGLFDKLNSVSSALPKFQRMDHSGRDIGDFNIFAYFKENHGAYSRIISRHDLTKLLYDSLPVETQAKMLPNKKVTDIATAADGVVVSCADGTSYAGSIVIGADGAHSLVRDIMRKLALKASPDVPAEDINEEQPFLTTYRAIWVRFPTQKGLKAGNAFETHGPRATVQLFAGEETSVIAVYERMDAPTRERIRWTEADLDAFIDLWGHLPISEHLTVRNAYDTRIGAGLVSLEEGVVKNWSFDRIVLVGDAAHKFTPSTGTGCNNGIVDIVALVNELHPIVSEATGGAPFKDEIKVAFKRYQDNRFKNVIAACQSAGQATASATWQTTIHKFIDQKILPIHIVQKFFASQAAKRISQTPVLDFVEGKEQLIGKIAWAQSIRPATLAAY